MGNKIVVLYSDTQGIYEARAGKYSCISARTVVALLGILFLCILSSHRVLAITVAPVKKYLAQRVSPTVVFDAAVPACAYVVNPWKNPCTGGDEFTYQDPRWADFGNLGISCAYKF